MPLPLLVRRAYTASDFICQAGVETVETCSERGARGGRQLYFCDLDNTCRENCDQCQEGQVSKTYPSANICQEPPSEETAETCFSRRETAETWRAPWYFCDLDNTCRENCDQCEKVDIVKTLMPLPLLVRRLPRASDFICQAASAETCSARELFFCDLDNTCRENCDLCQGDQFFRTHQSESNTCIEGCASYPGKPYVVSRATVSSAKSEHRVTVISVMLAFMAALTC